MGVGRWGHQVLAPEAAAFLETLPAAWEKHMNVERRWLDKMKAHIVVVENNAFVRCSGKRKDEAAWLVFYYFQVADLSGHLPRADV